MAPQWVVAGRPSSSPRSARMNAPVHTDMLSSFFAVTFLTQAMPASLRVKLRELPPGSTRMSGTGAFSTE